MLSLPLSAYIGEAHFAGYPNTSAGSSARRERIRLLQERCQELTWKLEDGVLYAENEALGSQLMQTQMVFEALMTDFREMKERYHHRLDRLQKSLQAQQKVTQDAERRVLCAKDLVRFHDEQRRSIATHAKGICQAKDRTLRELDQQLSKLTVDPGGDVVTSHEVECIRSRHETLKQMHERGVSRLKQIRALLARKRAERQSLEAEVAQAKVQALLRLGPTPTDVALLESGATSTALAASLRRAEALSHSHHRFFPESSTDSEDVGLESATAPPGHWKGDAADNSRDNNCNSSNDDNNNSNANGNTLASASGCKSTSTREEGEEEAAAAATSAAATAKAAGAAVSTASTSRSTASSPPSDEAYKPTSQPSNALDADATTPSTGATTSSTRISGTTKDAPLGEVPRPRHSCIWERQLSVRERQLDNMSSHLHELTSAQERVNEALGSKHELHEEMKLKHRSADATLRREERRRHSLQQHCGELQRVLVSLRRSPTSLRLHLVSEYLRRVRTYRSQVDNPPPEQGASSTLEGSALSRISAAISAGLSHSTLRAVHGMGEGEDAPIAATVASAPVTAAVAAPEGAHVKRNNCSSSNNNSNNNNMHIAATVSTVPAPSSSKTAITNSAAKAKTNTNSKTQKQPRDRGSSETLTTSASSLSSPNGSSRRCSAPAIASLKMVEPIDDEENALAPAANAHSEVFVSEAQRHTLDSDVSSDSDDPELFPRPRIPTDPTLLHSPRSPSRVLRFAPNLAEAIKSWPVLKDLPLHERITTISRETKRLIAMRQNADPAEQNLAAATVASNGAAQSSPDEESISNNSKSNSSNNSRSNTSRSSTSTRGSTKGHSRASKGESRGERRRGRVRT
mmetsp:Transcript_48040/g.103515  ORF Transcript_48040/g.103515 Transcript_48040/m.103515 type:complete len:860 (-) Transcript_48040:418-2997(-)